MKATKLTVSDVGRGENNMEIAVEQVGKKMKVFPYVKADCNKRTGHLNGAFWRNHGFAGRLEIYDVELGVAYIVE